MSSFSLENLWLTVSLVVVLTVALWLGRLHGGRKAKAEFVIPKDVRVFSAKELAQASAATAASVAPSSSSPSFSSQMLLLGIVGHIFDVSDGSRFYGPGGGYSFFSGGDFTRAYATGDFSPSGLVDNIGRFKSTPTYRVFIWGSS